MGTELPSETRLLRDSLEDYPIGNARPEILQRINTLIPRSNGCPSGYWQQALNMECHDLVHVLLMNMDSIIEADSLCSPSSLSLLTFRT